MPSPQPRNMRSIALAKEAHNRTCDSPPHTILMNPFEINRMEWEEGDRIAGMTLKADTSVGTGAFRLLCDRNQPEIAPHLAAEREKVPA